MDETGPPVLARPDPSPPTPAPAPPSAPPPRRRTASWTARLASPLAAAALTAAGLVLLLVVALTRPGGPVHADRPEPVVLNTVSAPVTTDLPVQQSFSGGADGLSSVAIRLGTFGGVTRCSVEVRLTTGSREVASRAIPCRTIPDSRVIEALEFPPEADSRDRGYLLEISAGRDDAEAVTVWAGRGDGDRPVGTQAGAPLAGTVELHTGYGTGGRVAGQIGTALRRIAQYGPSWHGPAFVVGWAVLGLGALIAIAAVRNNRARLVLVVGFAVAKGLLWSTVIPPLESPDEPAHFSYAEFMADAGRIPKRDSPAFGLTLPYSDQLYRAEEVLNREAAAPSDRPRYGTGADGPDEERLRGLSARSSGNGAAAGYPPLYYAPAALLYELAPSGVADKLAVMRLWSVVLGATAAGVAVLVGRRLFPGSGGAAAALGVAVASQPMLSQQTSTLNNDALVIAGGAVCLLIALDLTRPAGSRPRWLMFAAGLAVGLTTLGKQFGAAFTPVLALAWLVGRLRTPRADRPPWLVEGFRAAGGVAITYGAWLAVSVIGGFKPAVLGDLSAGEGPTTLGAYVHTLTRNSYHALYANWVQQFWGNFSWVDTYLPDWAYALLLVASLVGLLATAAWVVRAGVDLLAGSRRRRAGEGFEPDGATVGTAVCLLTVTVTMVMLLTVGYLAFHQSGKNDLLQGRYALMALPALLALPALYLGRFARRVPSVLPMAVVAAAMVALNILSTGILVERFYL